MLKSDCSGGGCSRHDAPDVAAGEALHSVNVEDAATAHESQDGAGYYTRKSTGGCVKQEQEDE